MESRRRSGGRAFWFRLTDNLFRRLPWFVLPILMLSTLGFSQARSSPEVYRSTATLSTSNNPLVPAQQIAGVTAGAWETPADATSRIINERLRTDSFLAAVAEEAGLSSAVDSGAIALAVLRENVFASSAGASIISIAAQWNDPRTAQALSAAAIDAYQGFLESTVASQSDEAIAYYTQQLDQLVAERDSAQDALARSVAALTDDELSAIEQIEVSRLTSTVTRIEERMIDTQGEIDSAVLAGEQATSEALRSITVIDPPLAPSNPVSSAVDRLITVFSFTLLGLVLAGLALALTTVLDQTVVSPLDLVQLNGVALVATAPTLNQLIAKRSRWRRAPKEEP